jgi:hypothetical protein
MLEASMIDDEHHVLNHWRLKAGGELPKVDTEDSLLGMIKTIGIEYYPVHLLPEKYFPRSIRCAYLAKNHNLSDEFCKLILKDKKLKKFFNHIGDTSRDTFFSYYTSCGHGATIQLSIFFQYVLKNSYYLMILSGKDSVSDYLDAIEKNIEMLRILGDKKTLKVPIFIGFSNITFPKDTKLELLNGALCSFDNRLVEILSKDVISRNSRGDVTSIVYQGFIDYQYRYKENDQKIKWPKLMEENYEKIDRLIENIELSTYLACDRVPPISMKKSWEIIFDPLALGIHRTWSCDQRHPTERYECTSEDLITIKKWHKKIEQTNDEKIRLAVRKLISLSSDRLNPIDGFLDGIIALENLFGSNAELGYRISMSVAFLLENDYKERKKLQKCIKDMYSLRSSYVHGSKDISREKAIEKRDCVARIGFQCLAHLYQKDSDLIASKEERSREIMLKYGICLDSK